MAVELHEVVIARDDHGDFVAHGDEAGVGACSGRALDDEGQRVAVCALFKLLVEAQVRPEVRAVADGLDGNIGLDAGFGVGHHLVDHVGLLDGATRHLVQRRGPVEVHVIESVVVHLVGCSFKADQVQTHLGRVYGVIDGKIRAKVAVVQVLAIPILIIGERAPIVVRVGVLITAVNLKIPGIDAAIQTHLVLVGVSVLPLEQTVVGNEEVQAVHGIGRVAFFSCHREVVLVLQY